MEKTTFALTALMILTTLTTGLAHAEESATITLANEECIAQGYVGFARYVNLTSGEDENTTSVALQTAGGNLYYYAQVPVVPLSNNYTATSVSTGIVYDFNGTINVCLGVPENITEVPTNIPEVPEFPLTGGLILAGLAGTMIMGRRKKEEKGGAAL